MKKRFAISIVHFKKIYKIYNYLCTSICSKMPYVHILFTLQYEIDFWGRKKNDFFIFLFEIYYSWRQRQLKRDVETLQGKLKSCHFTNNDSSIISFLSPFKASQLCPYNRGKYFSNKQVVPFSLPRRCNERKNERN